jgi:hypothetical protein
MPAGRRRYQTPISVIDACTPGFHFVNPGELTGLEAAGRQRRNVSLFDLKFQIENLKWERQTHGARAL